MKKLFLILLLVSSLAGVAFADSTHDTINNFYGGIENKGGTASATATVGNVSGGAGGAGGTASITDNSKTYNTNTNVNTNVNTNKIDNTNIGINKQQQGQKQGQVQGQMQGQNNEQVINPVQSIVFEKPYAPAPSVSSPPELNFGNGRMTDVTSRFPKFALFGIRPLGREDVIMEVLSVTANEPFKKIYKTILSDAKSVAESQKGIIKIRYQIIEAEAQKSWTTGGSIGGAGTGTLGTAGVGASGGLFPQVGGTKAHFLYTVIFVKVSD